MKIRKLKLTGIVLLYPLLMACGMEIPEDAIFAAGDENNAISDESYFLDDSEYASSESEEVSGENHEVIRTLAALHKQEKFIVATCLGISDQVLALEAKKEELIASGLERDEVKAELREMHEEIKASIKLDKEAFKSCREEARSSTFGLAIEGIIEGCWDKPENLDFQSGDRKRFKKRGRRGPYGGANLQEGDSFKSGMKMRKKKHKGLRLPPRSFANFDTEQCVIAVADGQSLLDGLNTTEEVIEEVEETEEVVEETDETVE